MSGIIPRVSRLLLVLTANMAVVFSAPAAPRPAAAAWRGKVDARVLDGAALGKTEFLVVLAEHADLAGAAGFQHKHDKGLHVYQRLAEVAQRTQTPLLKLLKARGLEHRPFWIVNMIWVRGTLADVQWIGERPEVTRILANPTVHFQEPVAAPAAPSLPAAVEWNITKVRAPEVWSLGYTGQGVVIAGQDTGYQWNHPALINRYRGWDGTNANHNFNWHDAIHTHTNAPYDRHGHGTHTMGIMVGSNATTQTGMVPGAKWIGCRNMDDAGNGTPASYTECFEWFLAPTDLSGTQTNTALAPDVINNSWHCTPGEGCIDPLILTGIVNAVRAAGIVVVVSAGNSGPNCDTIGVPAIYDASFTVGSTDSNDNIAGNSSRGPVTVDGSNRIKPDISAPGVGIYSTYPSNSYTYISGTSMAGPHVAGLVALLISAHLELRGQVDIIESLIAQTAVPRTTTNQTCGGVPGTNIPNNTYGWGRIDAFAALGFQDSDGDGMSDYQEVLAGTNPRDVASVLRITNLQRSGANWQISFTTVTNRLYDLERADTLTAPAWSPVTNNLPGTGQILQVTDPGAASFTQRFYRVTLAP